MLKTANECMRFDCKERLKDDRSFVKKLARANNKRLKRRRKLLKEFFFIVHVLCVKKMRVVL